MQQTESQSDVRWAHFWHRYGFVPERTRLEWILKEVMIPDVVWFQANGNPESGGRPATPFEIDALHLPKSSYVAIDWCSGRLKYTYLAEKDAASEVIAIIERLDDLSWLLPAIMEAASKTRRTSG